MSNRSAAHRSSARPARKRAGLWFERAALRAGLLISRGASRARLVAATPILRVRGVTRVRTVEARPQGGTHTSKPGPLARRACEPRAIGATRTGSGAPHCRDDARAGFTLLEVLISIGILSLGLATVFGSSIMASRGTAHARMVTQAGLLAQCRMSAVEAYLRQNQLPEADQTLDDPPETGGERCCEGAFTCTANVSRIELPQPTDLGSAAGDRLLNSATGASRGQSFGSVAAGGMAGALGGGDGGGAPGSNGGPGAIGALAGALSSLGAGGGSDPMSGIAGSLMAGAGGGAGGGGGLAGAGAPNLQGMATELLTGIYPTLKPLLEGAIRKVTVSVRWNEGSREFHMDVVEYVTNPGQSIRSGDQLNALDQLMGGAGAGGAPGGASTTAPGTAGSTGIGTNNAPRP